MAFQADDASQTVVEASLQRDLLTNHARLMSTRWAAGAVLLAATFLSVHLLRLPLPELALYGLGVVILAYNALLLWMTRRRTLPIQRLILLQIALDWLSMAAVLHLTGGITSPAQVIFFIHVIMVTILLPGESPYIYAGLAWAMVAMVAVLEAVGVLSHRTAILGLPPDLYANVVYIMAQLVFFAIALFAMVFLTASFMARLRERERQIAALFQTTQAVSSTLDVYSVLEHLAFNAAQALQMPGASIRLLAPGGDQLTMVASHGLSQSYLGKGPVSLSQSKLDREALSGQVVIIQEAQTDPRIQYPKQVGAEGIRSMLVVPIVGVQARRLGVLRIYSDEPGCFDSDDADFVRAIAQQGATAIENALAHESIREADEERAQFVRMVTHELRSPVTGSQSLLRVLLDNLAGELNERQRDIVARVSTRMDSLLALINDLLEVAANKSVRRDEPLAPVPLVEALSQVMDRFYTQAEEKSLALVLEAPDDEVMVEATPDGLGRIFGNLVGNALKYTPEQGRVVVSVDAEDRHEVGITVTDTGIGIPEGLLSRLGEEFFRAPNAKQSGIIGTGLGLTIVKQLIERFDGRIHVESEEGAGSSFQVTLRRAEDA